MVLYNSTKGITYLVSLNILLSPYKFNLQATHVGTPGNNGVFHYDLIIKMCARYSTYWNMNGYAMFRLAVNKISLNINKN